MRSAVLAILLLLPSASAGARMETADCLALGESLRPLLEQTIDLLAAVGEADRRTEAVRLRMAEGEDQAALEQAAVRLSHAIDVTDAMIKTTRQAITELQQRCP